MKLCTQSSPKKGNVIYFFVIIPPPPVQVILFNFWSIDSVGGLAGSMAA